MTDLAQTSDVWKCFEKLKEEKKAKCILCLRKLAYHGGTSNLREHLVKIHPLKYKAKMGESSKAKQTSLDCVLKPRQCSESHSREITERVINMIAMEILFCIVVDAIVTTCSLLYFVLHVCIVDDTVTTCSLLFYFILYYSGCHCFYSFL